MLPRTIDKARALLPGGNPGSYFITPGMSAFVLGKLGLDEAAFVALVAAAADETAVAERVLNGIDAARVARWSALIEALRVDQIAPDLQQLFDQLYPRRAPGELVLDILAADDTAAFAGPPLPTT